MTVTIKPLFTVSSLCGKVELSKGEICQVCWTDGRGRMTVWGHPRCMFLSLTSYCWVMTKSLPTIYVS